jgi:KipI family sensor histidine kinase inhibitor
MSDAQILPLGPDGVLVRFADALSEPANRAALAFRAEVDGSVPDGVTETATSLTSVFLRFDPSQLRRAHLEDHLRLILETRDWTAAELPENRTRWHVPAAFDGEDAPDLEAVAREIGRDPDAAIEEITFHPLRVLALGFAPGQPYLGFLPEHWNIPRRTEVTPQVPRGAVVVAVRQAIPFANAAPTGWWQIGRTAFRCYDPANDPALPLRAGDEVRFRAVSSNALAGLTGKPFGGAEREAIS